jgi:parallel beta-helix repeat protein
MRSVNRLLLYVGFCLSLIPLSHSQLTSYVSAWSSSVSYTQYQIVLYSGGEYMSLINGNVGNTPSSSSSYWQKLADTSASLPLGGNGAIVAPSVQGVMNANTLTTNTGADSDLGKAISDYFSSCSHSCTVYIPSGTYSYSTTITIPGVTAGSYRLIGEKGTVLNYTGSADAILAAVTLPSGDSNLQISGFQLIGTSKAATGIHLTPSNAITVEEMQISGFSSGSGIWVEGTNGISLQNNFINNNKNGILLESTFCTGSTCGVTGSGSEYDPNAIHIHDNFITGNSQWGILLDTPSIHGIAFNNSINSNILESNGSGSTYGDIFIARGQGTVIEGNYFEASPRHIVLGYLGLGSDYESSGDHISGNFFTSATSAPYNIELENSRWTVIDGNNDWYSSGPICEIQTPASGDEYGTVVGLNGFTTGNNLTCVGTTAAALPGTNSFTQPVIQTATFSGCSITPGSIGTTCSAGGNWSTPFAGYPSNVVCQIAVAGTGANALGALVGLSSTGVDVQEIAVSTSAAGGGVIQCVAQWTKN